jgi:hypothetical protein
METKHYNLFLDDIRELSYLSNVISPLDSSDWIVCRNSFEALSCVINNGIPNFISFDHDLGGEDTAMVFVKKWVEEIEKKFPAFYIHSSNPIGKENLRSFIFSYNRSFEE